MRATDQEGLFFEQTTFVIVVNNVDEPITDITLSVTSVEETASANHVVGTLTGT